MPKVIKRIVKHLLHFEQVTEKAPITNQISLFVVCFVVSVAVGGLSGKLYRLIRTAQIYRIKSQISRAEKQRMDDRVQNLLKYL